MTRRSISEIRVNKMLSLDAESYRKFAELVGPGNVSEEIRAMIKERILTPAEGINALEENHNKQPSYIFHDFDVKDKRDELTKYINLEPDMKKLNILFKNCMAAATMINRRKLENSAKAKFDQRASQKSNEEIINDVKNERRRMKV